MARLLIKSDNTAGSVIELKLGVNRVGRSPENDFSINHPTVSSFHCEFVLADGAVLLHDCNSTNGTFVNGDGIKEAALLPGQTVHLGDVELFVETTDVVVAIPRIERPRPAAPLLLEDGTTLCSRHPQAPVKFKCTHCRELMCDACVHRIRRQGGKTLRLCPLCSHKVERIGGPKRKENALLVFLRKTVKIPFLWGRKETDFKP